VTEADILAGEVLNVATGKGTSPDPDEPEVPVEPGEDPEPTEEKKGHLTIEKETTSKATAESGKYALGEEITYKITAKNDGNLTITDITVTDELTGDEWTIASLAPNASEEFTAKYVVTEADILAGEVLNVATGKGTSPDPDEPEVPVEPGEDPEPTEDVNASMTVEKKATSTPANGESYALGETVSYEIVVTNTGNVTYRNVVVTDELTGLSKTIAELAVGATEKITTEYVVTSDDILAGKVLNVVTVTADPVNPDDPDNPIVPEDEDVEEVPTDEPDASMTVEKKATSTPANGETYAIGETVSYEIVVTNTGNVTYKNVVVTDELTGLSETIAELAVGVSQTFTTEYVVNEADALAGKVLNVATVTADPVNPDDPDNPIVPEDEDVEEVPVAQPCVLTVRYWVNDTPAFDTFTKTYDYGATYNVVSPVMLGYTASLERVTGTITQDITVDVYYTPLSYNLTINYRYADGRVAAGSYVAVVEYGAEYNVASPTIGGYRASQRRVQGTMPSHDVEITVYYTAIPAPVPELIVIDDYGTPLGLGNVSLNAGDCIE